VYYWPGAALRKNGVDSLHREIWKSIHGPIPAGHEIDHKNGDSLDNDPSNLQCLSVGEHRKKHSADFSASKRVRENLDRIRPLASAWHSSPEGRAWHSEHSKKDCAGTEQKFSCAHCGREYIGVFRGDGKNCYCSPKCCAAARRKSGLDDETRECAFCGKSFVVNRYSKKIHCDRVCGQRHRRAEGGGV
jgi:hypothetical protein